MPIAGDTIRGSSYDGSFARWQGVAVITRRRSPTTKVRKERQRRGAWAEQTAERHFPPK
jgi:hypothetical protein